LDQRGVAHTHRYYLVSLVRRALIAVHKLTEHLIIPALQPMAEWHRSYITFRAHFAQDFTSKRPTGILAWFWHPISNGPAEGSNSAIQTLKNIARGYRNFANVRIAILFLHGKLHFAPH